MNKLGTAALAELITSSLGACATTTSHPAASHPRTSNSAPAVPVSHANAPVTGPGNVLVTQTAREGQAFKQSYTYSDGTPAAWTITLDSAVCGNVLSPAVIGTEQSSTGVQVTSLTPPAGDKWCLVKFTVTNDGTASQIWDGDDSQYTTLNAGQNAYAPPMPNDASAWTAYQAYSSQPGPEAAGGLNPQETGTSWGVYELPVNSKITSVSVQNGGIPAEGTNTQTVIALTS